MTPSEEDVANFIACAPDAGEGIAFVFLEGANSVDEALNQYFENPNKYSHPVTQTKGSKESRDSHIPPASMPSSNMPPPYTPPVNNVSGSRRRQHTNAVIEAGHVRARDEVRLFLILLYWPSYILLARNAKPPATRSNAISHLQQRYRTGTRNRFLL